MPFQSLTSAGAVTAHSRGQVGSIQPQATDNNGAVEIAPDLPFNAGMMYLPGIEPLNEDEFDFLDRVLAKVRGGAIPNAEALDGFFTALVICPDLVRPSEYMEVIRSGASKGEELVFDGMDEVEKFHGLLMRHWNAVNAELRRGEPHMPVLNVGEDGIARGNDWAKGFLAGVDLRQDAWRAVINDEERAGPFVPIWALAYEHHPDPAMRPYKEPITAERREDLIVAMAPATKRLFDDFAIERRFAASATSTYTRPSPKIGRNDPCPCGSGKKYKQCHGKLA